jgi:hypothetical protein
MFKTVNYFNCFNSAWSQFILNTTSACSNTCSPFRDWITSDRSRTNSCNLPHQYPTTNSSPISHVSFHKCSSPHHLISFLVRLSSCCFTNLKYLFGIKKIHIICVPSYTVTVTECVYTLDTGDHIPSLNFSTTISNHNNAAVNPI